MSVYSELLRLTLAEEEGRALPLPQLIGLVLSRRRDLEADTASPAGDPVRNMGSSLAYDAALVALCRRLGVPETLTEGDEVTGARRQIERLLADRLPSMQPIMGET